MSKQSLAGPSVDINLSPKQYEAYEYLTDKEHTEVFYGGAAGGGKSWLGCIWIALKCLEFPGSRWLMGRAVLSALKQSTLLSFWEVTKKLQLKPERDFHYNSQSNVIKFKNGSEIYLKDLFRYPSDPEFDSLGSTEFTGAFIDEGSQITAKAKNIVMSRIRYKLDEFKTIPKLFIASNPSKNFLYTDYYKPHKNGKLQSYIAFVQAFVQDNPYISTFYIENLKKLDPISKQRLLYGNWEYDDDPSKLMEYEKIVDLFNNFHIKERDKNARKYLVCDPARFGQDRTVIMLWKGLWCYHIEWHRGWATNETEQRIRELCTTEGIMQSDGIVDDDGIGGAGIVDHMENIRGFVNNARATEGSNYSNIKTECYFRLAGMVNEGNMYIETDDPEIRDLIISDLEQVKRRDADKDGKIMIVKKEDMKEHLGRSPDFGDCLMMRMRFELGKGDVFILEDPEGVVF